MNNMYRHLTDKEVSRLVAQGCKAEDWSKVYVPKMKFLVERVEYVSFMGTCYLGINDGSVEVEDGLRLPSIVSHATLIDCRLGENCRISRIGRYIRNCHVGDEARIEDVSLLASSPFATCGEGTRASLLVETGGREVVLYSSLNAQMAYLMTFMRHQKAFINHLVARIDENIESSCTEKSEIGQGAVIVDCGTIHNLKVGPYAKISGVRRINNVTVNSIMRAPAVILGADLIEDSVISEGAFIEGAILKRSFVGESVEISGGFSAHDSLFFANCAMENGESCASFLAPHSVSMHKSSLMIGGYFSFVNLGSGTNQSNHLYKLGATQQGVLERGCKFTSDSYVLWPAHIGAFTMIKGRHYRHPDTSLFPYSYLIAEEGEDSILLPGRCFFTIGYLRDVEKWPNRDGRKGSKADIVDYAEFAPSVIASLMKGYEILKKHSQNGNGDYVGQGFRIPSGAIPKSLHCYEMILAIYLERMLVEHCELLHESENTLPEPEWIDMAGGIFNLKLLKAWFHEPVEHLMDYEEMLVELKNIHRVSLEMEPRWAMRILRLLYPDTDKGIEAVERVLGDALAYESELASYFENDAAKEFSKESLIGFAPYAGETDNKAEFDAVKGRLQELPLIKSLKSNLDARKSKIASILEKLRK